MGGIRGLTLKMTIFGESHGPAVGIVLDGLPPGLAVNREKIARDMARRAPGRSCLSTRRREEDDFLVQSGVYEGHTTGTPLCVLIPNRDQHSDDYKELRHAVRPGHADYTVSVRSGGWADLRGGGHSSGRITAPLVWAGSLARSWLEEREISLAAHFCLSGEQKTVLLIRRENRKRSCGLCRRRHSRFWKKKKDRSWKSRYSEQQNRKIPWGAL